MTPGPTTAALTTTTGPGWRATLANAVGFQFGWFGVIGLVAAGEAGWALALLAAVLAAHLAVVPAPRAEARLLLACSGLGLAWETVFNALGLVAYPHGQWAAWLPPLWLVGMWTLFAATLNHSLAWLHGRPWLQAVLGAIAGPMSYAGGVALGAADWQQRTPALVVLALAWALLLPLTMALADRGRRAAVNR
ncbi:DUF2878 domain-containing protein [Aquabacterium sp. J223]|uniref:DUF2878 domain-containing protein n=1 Tax=Aquabacterium sp. J223 TaxID=2898431 RepID=UPI0021AE2786|nr:DUF2878 domain-containing protein [Aquabacterium sp. J223]UUX97449.1 DUF2878 domain-containing protein [Aquabacterium sp. J223]